MKEPGNEIKSVCVMGLGYIGLPTAALLATKGFQVHGVDINPATVAKVNAAQVPIMEPELDAFVKSAVHSGRLRAAAIPAPADIFLITVPTPVHEDLSPDVSFVFDAIKAITRVVREGNLVILESTSPVGTTREVFRRLTAQPAGDKKIFVAYSPERVLPGQTMRELIQNDRIVGGVDEASAQAGKRFYETFVQGEVLVTDDRTAELSKLVENANRDVNIAFANELSMICDRLEIDVWELITLANRHPRISILKPSSGVGGHCIAIDPWFIAHAAKEESLLIQTARRVNNTKPLWVLGKLKSEIARFRQTTGKEPLVAVMGLSFKPNIDDTRESPALRIVEGMRKENIRMLVVEPNIKSMEGITLTETSEALEQADIILFLVAHERFVNSTIPSGKIVIDVCGVTSRFGRPR